jgi:hypothetical protein
MFGEIETSESSEEERATAPPAPLRSQLIVPTSEVIQISDQIDEIPTSSTPPLMTRDEIFQRYLKWKSLLVDSRPPEMIPKFPNNKIILDEPNQRVIRVDCERTRGTHPEFRLESTRHIMESIITFYCKTVHVKYKQGMNEVLAPFVYLKLALDDGSGHELQVPGWNEVFQLYYAFIQIFLPSMFNDEEFKYLQKSCTLFRTLLRYHAPALSGRLDSASVTPEMYVTPWFLTVFAAKTSLATTMAIWDRIITDGDKYSFIFLSVSLCVSHARILRSSSRSSLPEAITRISITQDAVSSCWKRAAKIRTHTPPYFCQQLDDDHTIDSFPPHLVKQLGGTLDETSPSSTTSDGSTNFVVDMTFPMLLRPLDLFRRKDNWRFLVLDCRPNWSKNFGHMGSLPLSIPFDLETLVYGQSIFPVNEALKRVAEIVGVNVDSAVPTWPIDTHICIMGLSDALIDAVGLFYMALSKVSNVPRVSILKGGYQAVHAQVPQELIDHDDTICPLCNRIPIQQLAKRQLRLDRSLTNSGDDTSPASSGPASPGGMIGGAIQRFKSFVTDSGSGGSSSLFRGSGGGSFLVGTIPPLPTTKWVYNPQSPPGQYVSKCQLNSILSKSPCNDIESNALLIVSDEFLRCCAAPLDMTILIKKCELKMYGNWKLTDLIKITSRNNQPGMLLFYFSVEAEPDLVITMISTDIARTTVDEVRRRFRIAKKSNSS